MRFAIAGAGFSGAVIARQLAEAGHLAVVHETRDHVAGNCFTSRDSDTGVTVHRYGPHIFHTANERVWSYINRFGEMIPYYHRVRTTVGGHVYQLPVNLLTINQLFGTAFSPDDARAFVAEQADSSIGEPTSFEEQALNVVGRRIYETLFAGYTRKQWGLDPNDLPASILKRLPIRFNYDDSYYDHPYQAIPRNGYTEIVERILDHPSIEVRLNTTCRAGDGSDSDHVIWTGKLDAWFGFQHGPLAYRTLDFEEIRFDGDFQGCAVMNYGDVDVPYTRITEHKYLAPWEQHDRSICHREYSRQATPDDIPYYPIPVGTDGAPHRRYLDAARAERGVTFIGRLGTYRYLDMDTSIGEALEAADRILETLGTRRKIPPLFIDPA